MLINDILYVQLIISHLFFITFLRFLPLQTISTTELDDDGISSPSEDIRTITSILNNNADDGLSVDALVCSTNA